MKIPPFILVLLIGLFVFIGIYFFAYFQREEGFVVKVVDGDTLELNTTEKVRLLGINAPERGEPFYQEAKNMLAELVLNKKVYLEKDREERDRYGRLLRYVYLGDEMVNLKMVEEGYATVYFPEGDGRYRKILENGEEEARDMKKGLWSLLSEDRCADCIVVEEFHWDAEGNDCENPNGEWVTLGNICPFDCELTRWSVKDSGTNIYRFSNLRLGPNESLKLLSGPGEDTSSQLHWNRRGACPVVWNNNGDILYLRDREGKLVLRESYEGFR